MPYTINWNEWWTDSIQNYAAIRNGAYTYNLTYRLVATQALGHSYPVLSVTAPPIETREKKTVKIPIEILEELVESIPIPTDVEREFLWQKRSQPTNQNYWKRRVAKLWRNLLVTTPISEWTDGIYLDNATAQWKLSFNSRAYTAVQLSSGYSNWAESVLISQLQVRKLLSELKLGHGFVIKETETFYQVVPTISADARVGAILGLVADKFGTLRIYRNHESLALWWVINYLYNIERINRDFTAHYKDKAEVYDRLQQEGDLRRGINVQNMSTEKWQAFFESRRDSIPLEELRTDNIDTLPISPHGLRSSRQWGIEIEAAGARYADTPAGWDRKGDSSLESAYEDGGYNENDESAEYYVDAEDCVHDHNRLFDNGDQNPDYYDVDICGYHGWQQNEDYVEYRGDTGEFVSPILHSFHSRGLETLVNQLQNEPQNDSAGIHVHVDVDDLTPKQIGGLVFGYEMVEPLIEESYRRETRTYCKSREPYEVVSVIRSSNKATKKARLNYYDDDPDTINPGDRYVSLNLVSLSAHGTVEFRAMGPVYEYEHLIRWAHFAREMVNLAKSNVTQKEWSGVKSFGQLRALFAQYGSEQDGAFRDITDNVILEDAELAEV